MFSLFNRDKIINIDNPKSSIKLDPTIKLEKQVAEQIYNALQGQVVTEVLQQLNDSGSDVWWRSNMEGHSLKVAKELLPDMYELCNSVKEKLEFKGTVDF